MRNRRLPLKLLKGRPMQAWLLLSLLFVGSAFAPLLVSPPGINTPEPIGKFLNGNLPSITPSDGSPVSFSVEPAFPGLRFDSPLVIEMHPTKDTMFVAQRDGLIEYFHHDPAVTTKTTFLDLRNETAVVWDGGFLGLAFHPEFGNPTSPNRNYFYVFYCAKGPTGQEGPVGPIAFTCENNPTYEGSYMILSRFEVQNNTLNVVPGSEQVMIKLRLYNSTHRGGGLTFGNDNMLYLTLGEQARYTTSQNIYSNFEGGTIRIDVDQNSSTGHAPIRKMGLQTGNADEFTGVGYYIPNDNPWQDNTGAIFEEFWTTGHRNPHRLTLDPVTGDLWVGEIGGGQREEINLLESGRNYGWPLYEGNLSGTTGACGSNTMALGPGTYQAPVVDFLRSESNCIIGGYVYRGSSIPQLEGQYICGGYSQNRIFAVQDTGTGYFKTTIANFSPSALITFGVDQAGELYMGKEGNNVTLYTLKAANSGPPAPQWLSMTGAFSDLATLTPSAGVIPYEMVEAFWSDNAEKYRWLAVPNNEDGNGLHDKAEEKISFSSEGEWDFPAGAVLIKHFELGGKRLETRFEVKGDDGLYYYLTYKWNVAGTDAELLNGSLDEVVNVNGKNQTWHYPSKTECLSCHQAAVGSVLGPKTRHLNKSILYPSSGLKANQLVTLSHLGILDQAIVDADTGNYPTLAPKDMLSASLEDRARSYLDVNCSHCHRPETGNRATFDARFNTPLPLQGYINGSVIDPLGISGARVIVPQDTSRSILYKRLDLLGTNAMPPLAKDLIDTEGVQLIVDWINSLAPTSELPLATVGNASQLPGGCYELTPDANNQAGAAWYPIPLNLDQDMSASFNISLGDDNNGADGASFLIQQAGTSALGGQGTGQGVSGITPSIGVSFDTYGQPNDEIFIFENGNPATVITPRVCALSACTDIEDGNTYSAQIVWKAATQTLEVYFGGEFRQSYTGDIVNTHFGGDSWVYVGLGAGTGGATNQHSICNFNLQATFPPDAANPNGDGLQATYYNNMNFTNEALTRIDSTINFDWGTGSPDPAIGVNTFSVRWSGSIIAPFTGTYTFYSNTDDGVRLWVDDQQIINQWVDQGPTEWTGTINLIAGEPVSILMEYYENGGGAVAQLSWSTTLLPKQIISRNFFFQPGTTFPVEWLDIDAELLEDQVQLSWATSQEVNNQQFIVERSTDLQYFEEIGYIPSQGDSDLPQFYGFMDQRPAYGKNFYRIRQVDIDGQSSLSPTVNVNVAFGGTALRVYPNPVRPGQTIHVEVSTDQNGMMAASLFDMNGKQLYHSRMVVVAGKYIHTIPVNGLPQGSYVLKLQGETWQKQERILIH
ncbi:MAG: PQQ-dependent sugar dehydrogenase [Bacteroidia bacterium]|nr:PQQ-dependent sugar dehydrogenase [Bacteroidia bacterium]